MELEIWQGVVLRIRVIKRGGVDPKRLPLNIFRSRLALEGLGVEGRGCRVRDFWFEGLGG